MAAPGAPSQLSLPMSTPGAPSSSSPNRHATALLVNTLTIATGEDVPAWLRRNGLTDAARSGLVLERVTDFGMPFADRHDRFNGVTFALLDIVLPLGMNLPFADGLEFAPRLRRGCSSSSGTSKRGRCASTSPRSCLVLGQGGPCR